MRYFGLIVYSNHHPEEAVHRSIRRVVKEGSPSDNPNHILTRFYGDPQSFIFLTVYAAEVNEEALAYARSEDNWRWWDGEPEEED